MVYGLLVFLFLMNLTITTDTRVAKIINSTGYENSGTGLGSPRTVPEMLPDWDAGICCSWKFMFDVVWRIVTFTPVTFCSV